jgi:hypothetical protein
MVSLVDCVDFVEKNLKITTTNCLLGRINNGKNPNEGKAHRAQMILEDCEMKKTWLSALMMVTLVGAGTSALGEGTVKISVDGERVNAEVPASNAESVQELVNKLGGFTSYDPKSGRLQVEKPSVNILVLEGTQQIRNRNVVLSNPIKGYSDKAIPRTFNVFVEVDEAPVARELKMRLVLIGPDGKEVDHGKDWTYSTKSGTSFYFSEPFVSTKFRQYGSYKVQLRMKSEKYSDYVVVGENSFTVGR